MKTKFLQTITLRTVFARSFPRSVRSDLLAKADPRAYARHIDPFTLILVLLESHLCLASGLRDIVGRFSRQLKTRSLGTLSVALGSALMRNLAFLLHQCLCFAPPPKDALIVLDSMAVSLPKTRRHNCAPMNDKTVGGGILWGLILGAPRNSSPLVILKTMAGAWNDSAQIRGAALVARGPLYIMDRGFYAIGNLVEWLHQGVRFLLRARGKDLQYEPLKTLGKPRALRARTGRKTVRTIRVTFDGIARIGAPTRRAERPIARLVVCTLTGPSGKTEDLILVSSEVEADAQTLLDQYGRRWEIENLHRLLKRMVGLAHLYSFRQRGIELLMAVTALLAVLLWLASTDKRPAAQRLAENIVIWLTQALQKARRPYGIRFVWRPNTIAKNSWRHRT